VNPLAEDSKGVLMAADAKIGFDDNANFRQKVRATAIVQCGHREDCPIFLAAR